MKRRIIIANDVKFTLELETSFLQREGFTVHAAGSGREALELARQVKADLILLDYEMPLLSGIEVCARIRTDPALAHLPVLIVSDRDDGRVREACRKAGCTGFVSRSEGADGLLKAVAEALRVGVRRRARVPVKIEVQAGAHYLNFKAEARDLSVTGMLLETPEPIDVGLPVVVHFKLPGAKREITASAQVIRCSPAEGDTFLIATSLDTLDSEARKQLEAFLEQSREQTIALKRDP